MQTAFHPAIANEPYVADADRILRSCVHCGFCNAVCPTYQLLGDELDGPRGRIYLIKNMLEDNAVSRQSATHIDRCLTCRACETACPSGVDYVKLLDLGRDFIHRNSHPGLYQRCLRYALRIIVPSRNRLSLLVSMGRLVKWLLPNTLRALLGESLRVGSVLCESSPGEGSPGRSSPGQLEKPATLPVKATDNSNRGSKVILLDGCVQKVTTPGVNRALRKLLSLAGMEVISIANEGCCGAVEYHLSAKQAGLKRMRRLTDVLWPYVEGDAGENISAIISSASGCGVTLKDYSDYLKEDDEYAEKAKVVSAMVRDASQVFEAFTLNCKPKKIALQAPCTLQHGLKLGSQLELLLQKLGFELVDVPESHLCCGSAGTYSLTQPEIASELRERKMAALMSNEPEVIVTANVGCQLHLSGAGISVPVMHWIELVEQSLLQ